MCLRTVDFESTASAVSPPRHGARFNRIQYSGAGLKPTNRAPATQTMCRIRRRPRRHVALTACPYPLQMYDLRLVDGVALDRQLVDLLAVRGRMKIYRDFAAALLAYPGLRCYRLSGPDR